MEIRYKSVDGLSNDLVDEEHRLPVGLDERAFITARSDILPVTVTLPGLLVNDATDANDVMGALMEFPGAGRYAGGSFAINKAVLYDYGNVGASITLHLFSRPVTLAASDAAWSLSDADAAFWIDSIDFSTYKTHTNNQTSRVIPGIQDACEPNRTSIFGALQSVTAYTLPTGANAPPQIRLVFARD